MPFAVLVKHCDHELQQARSNDEHPKISLKLDRLEVRSERGLLLFYYPSAGK